ncbi:Nif3-like dinuclear metal center hexameric protein [Shewanella sp. Scap07]|uniref:Nif3-like dinuclear metal center hexameric protein n=1 Tax=Shewanella sp. Scap07 TaxID=2589987 RepID=UPI0015BD365F|nr:Nif3-like dinuclear metal center hexameric protein [Shewanella sp. Scap07]QLE85817.1 Nif3-like dinuclear metal center hexameric protein [Shewanella sp. Scap07]
MKRTELTAYLNEYLQVGLYKDYAPNGLQVEGSNDITTIVTGVTACQALIARAVELNADALLVHHGFFWKGEPEVLTGMKYRRIKALMDNNINLLGYHLPVDGHPEIGNNAELGRKMGMTNAASIEGVAQGLVWQGELVTPESPEAFAGRLHHALGRMPVYFGAEVEQIKRVAWCTGGAQDYIDIAVNAGADAFISGEMSERTYHSAVEQGIQYFSAGHHATERYGIKALGEHLATQFGLTHHFVDIDNPV